MKPYVHKGDNKTLCIEKQSQKVMERLSTGFQELDRLIEGGVPKPFCLSVCAEMNLGESARSIVWELMAQSLEDNHSCIYISLDLPASEIRQLGQERNHNFEEFEKQGKLTFLDFFSKRAEKLTSGELLDISDLSYEPNEIMGGVLVTMQQENVYSFIIIDTVSTLLLNLESRKAYELIRGFKMLTRTNNLIGIGISLIDSVDSQELDMLRSNADGCIRCEKEELWIERFDKTSFLKEKVKISTVGNGNVILERGPMTV